mmetsp:Transcript_7350/g.21295  ORF Transcript_7350/g.21295 Transcript_7350/m.21295 type:complete len:219 (-) Transcript_7350:296-952(-)
MIFFYQSKAAKQESLGRELADSLVLNDVLRLGLSLPPGDLLRVVAHRSRQVRYRKPPRADPLCKLLAPAREAAPVQESRVPNREALEAKGQDRFLAPRLRPDVVGEKAWTRSHRARSRNKVKVVHTSSSADLPALCHVVKVHPPEAFRASRVPVRRAKRAEGNVCLRGLPYRPFQVLIIHRTNGDLLSRLFARARERLLELDLPPGHGVHLRAVLARC